MIFCIRTACSIGQKQYKTIKYTYTPQHFKLKTFTNFIHSTHSLQEEKMYGQWIRYATIRCLRFILWPVVRRLFEWFRSFRLVWLSIFSSFSLFYFIFVMSADSQILFFLMVTQISVVCVCVCVPCLAHFVFVCLCSKYMARRWWIIIACWMDDVRKGIEISFIWRKIKNLPWISSKLQLRLLNCVCFFFNSTKNRKQKKKWL